MSEIGCSACEKLFDAEDVICPDCAAVQWVLPEKIAPLKCQTMLGLFEITKPSYFTSPLVIFKIKDEKYFGQDGSLLSPEYGKLLAWCPIPQETDITEPNPAGAA